MTAWIALIIIAVIFLGEGLAAAINYTWWWKEYRCRLEPVTYELRRYARKWWGVILTKTGLLIGALICLLLWPPADFSIGLKIATLVVVVLGITFYGWLMLHLGGIAMRIVHWLRKEA
jgi:hypothetical protein